MFHRGSFCRSVSWMFGVDNCLRAGVSPRLVLSQCLQPARRSRCHRCAHLLRHRVRPTKPVSARGRGRYLYRVEWGVKLYSNSNTRTSHKTRRCITRRARIVCGRVCVTVRCPSVSLSVRPSVSVPSIDCWRSSVWPVCCWAPVGQALSALSLALCQLYRRTFVLNHNLKYLVQTAVFSTQLAALSVTLTFDL